MIPRFPGKCINRCFHLRDQDDGDAKCRLLVAAYRKYGHHFEHFPSPQF